MTMSSDLGASLHQTVHDATPICSHRYHLQCIMQWSSQTNTCPECRSEYGAVVGPTLNHSTTTTPLRFAIGHKQQQNIASYAPFNEGEDDEESDGMFGGSFALDEEDQDEGASSGVGSGGRVNAARRRRRRRIPPARPAPSAVAQQFGRSSNEGAGSTSTTTRRTVYRIGVAATAGMADEEAVESIMNNFQARRNALNDVSDVFSPSSRPAVPVPVPVVVPVPVSMPEVPEVVPVPQTPSGTTTTTSTSTAVVVVDSESEEDEDVRMARLASMAMDMEKLADDERKSGAKKKKNKVHTKGNSNSAGGSKKRKAKLKLRRGRAKKAAPRSNDQPNNHNAAAPMSDYQRQQQARLSALVLILEECTMADRRAYVEALHRKRTQSSSDEEDEEDEETDFFFSHRSSSSSSASASKPSASSASFASTNVHQTLAELTRTLSQMKVVQVQGHRVSSIIHPACTISGAGLRLLLDCGLLRALKRCLQPLQNGTTNATMLPEEKVQMPILQLLVSMELLSSDLQTTGAGLPRLMQEYEVHPGVSEACRQIANTVRGNWMGLFSSKK